MCHLRHILFLLLLIMGAGCSGIRDQVGPPSIEQIQRLGSSGIEIILLLPNRSGHTLKILSTEIDFFYDATPLARAELRGEVKLLKRTENRLKCRFKLFSDDPAALLLLEKRLTAHEFEHLEIDYRIRMKCGLLKKTFSAEKVRLSEFLCTFVSEKELQEVF